MPFLLVKWLFSAKPKAMQSCIQSKFKNSVHFWTKFIQYECKVHDKTFFFQAEDGIRDLVRSRGLGDVYKRQTLAFAENGHFTNKKGMEKLI